MNLMEEKIKLIKLNRNLNLKAAALSNNMIKINNWLSVSNSLNLLRDYSFTKSQVDDIFSIDDIINVRLDEWTTSQAKFEILNYKINTLSQSIESCIKLIDEYTLEHIQIPEDSGLINVTLPNTVDMQKMSGICEDLDRVFQQCPLIKDEVKFVGVEKGSVIFIFLTTMVSIEIIGRVLNIALDVSRKYYVNQMLAEKLKTMRNLGELTESAIKELNDEVKSYCSTRATEVEGFESLEPEDQLRLSMSLELLSNLISQGLKLQCSLCENLSDSTTNSFPKADDYKNLIETLKLLG